MWLIITVSKRGNFRKKNVHFGWTNFIYINVVDKKSLLKVINSSIYLLKW